LPAEAAKDVVLAEKPVISDTSDVMEPSILDGLLSELGSLASVYHKPSAAFVSRARLAVQKAEDLVAARAAADDGVTGEETRYPFFYTFFYTFYNFFTSFHAHKKDYYNSLGDVQSETIKP
jgi:hypothetical protein